MRQSSRRKERKVRKRGNETGESDNVEKGEKTETDENESGEGRKITTETRTAHVMCKNTLGREGHDSHTQQQKQKDASKGSMSSKRPQVGNTDW